MEIANTIQSIRDMEISRGTVKKILNEVNDEHPEGFLVIYFADGSSEQFKNLRASAEHLIKLQEILNFPNDVIHKAKRSDTGSKFTVYNNPYVEVYHEDDGEVSI